MFVGFSRKAIMECDTLALNLAKTEWQYSELHPYIRNFAIILRKERAAIGSVKGDMKRIEVNMYLDRSVFKCDFSFLCC